MRIYRDLTDWYHLPDPLADHEDEADLIAGLLAERGLAHGELLELGCGAGNNASSLQRQYTCTLTDLSPQMLALSLAKNPQAEHVQGDMRTLRLNRTFGAVFAHDSLCYMLTEADLAAVAATAWAHLRSGGVAVFSPDCVREDF